MTAHTMPTVATADTMAASTCAALALDVHGWITRTAPDLAPDWTRDDIETGTGTPTGALKILAALEGALDTVHHQRGQIRAVAPARVAPLARTPADVAAAEASAAEASARLLFRVVDLWSHLDRLRVVAETTAQARDWWRAEFTAEDALKVLRDVDPDHRPEAVS